MTKPTRSIRIQGFNTRTHTTVTVEVARVGSNVYLSPSGRLDNALRLDAVELDAALDEVRPEETSTTEGD